MIFLNIVVLAGGFSSEREVSLSSGAQIAAALVRKGHKVALLDLSEDAYFCENEPLAVFRASFEYPKTSIMRNLHNPPQELKNGKIGRHVLSICALADMTFIALHGGMGEDGRLQALLEAYSIKHTGATYFGAIAAADKILTKKLLAASKIPSAEWLEVDADDFSEKEADRIIEKLGLPCVIKPCRGGSSIGVCMASSREELIFAISEQADCDGGLLAEKKLCGREFSVGILGGIPLPPIEIVIDEGFYDYKNKYHGKTLEICPADLSASDTERLCAAALRVFYALGLNDYARIDFILEGDEFYCLEANSLPGMTPTSLFPQEAAAMGFDFEELCEKILQLALARYKKR